MKEENGKNDFVVIHPSKGWSALDLDSLWRYRDLLFFLTWRDIKVRYKQTVIGAAWAVIQPLLMMVIFSLFFGRVFKVDSEYGPYPIFAYAGLLPWQMFSQALSHSGNSLVENQRLITKVYFPRLVVPISAILVSVVDFAVSFLVLLGLMGFYKVPVTPAILLLPVFILIVMLTALSAGLWLSALNVLYRDVRYTIAFLIQIWFFLTPVIYPSSAVPEKWRLFYAMNPMAGIIEGFRWSILGTGNYPGLMLAVSTGMVTILLFSGLFYFRRMERVFADVI